MWSNVDYVSAVLSMLVCPVVFKNEGFGYISIVQEVADKALADARGEVEVSHEYQVNGDVSWDTN